MEAMDHPTMQKLISLLLIESPTDRSAHVLDWISKNFDVSSRTYSIHPNEIQVHHGSIDSVHREHRVYVTAGSGSEVSVEEVEPAIDGWRTFSYSMLFHNAGSETARRHGNHQKFPGDASVKG